mmetsp:Transcript_20010/g.14722  ORF Transcript_20010/g.14722 Transcript_20010/m.14722 type:complete len:151 (+) Transcript_20010:235-687(+)|eukprot:CAMPEP_0202961374 /NCGR_PEP_ID=MMETSP1396-20130829/5413_1 /ASSEMBLY_ACC=CAM_ASM_000872 /TAXON_ID= /ORGANISM="Pseudokeronopsis sp., Strain Brazil" /LENGTH=150 /DNA_ID=CAMNT_0049681127 /DNA_START=4842 /DNA_END=5294 /DNA_ORIENTATION=-
MSKERPDYKKSLQENLMDVPLDQWAEYRSVVDNFEQFDSKSLELVCERLKLSIRNAALPEASIDLKVVKPEVLDAFENVKKTARLAKLDWQLQLASTLVTVHFHLGKKASMVTLGTGHGKSVIIQLVASAMATLSQKKVLIVCLNPFLAC